jgi:hypothetical protein
MCGENPFIKNWSIKGVPMGFRSHMAALAGGGRGNTSEPTLEAP